MRFCGSIFRQLLEPISRRWFEGVVERHDGNAYDKCFDSWDHLVTLIYAQLSHARSLRDLVASWNANGHHHFHLGTAPVARSTLADANTRRPIAIFAETFTMLSSLADRTLRREGAEMVRLIDSTPIPLDKALTWSTWNGRIHGLKMHVVYDAGADHPRRIDITPANVNDVEVGQKVVIEAGATYVFDKAYCSYVWWTRLHAAGSVFITRKKDNARLRSVLKRPLENAQGCGFTVLEDCEVKLVSKGNAKLPIPLRRIRVQRYGGARLTLITNDMTRPAVQIAALYKARWQIELLFRWIKQHLKLSTFMGRSENAVRLQILAAMIAFLLLRIAARAHVIKMLPIRFAGLIGEMLFVRKPITRIDKPPEVNASKPRPRTSANQLELCYA